MMLTILIIGAAATLVENPIAPAAKGELQCYAPNDAEKSCMAIASYRPIGASQYLNGAEILVADEGEGPVTVITSTVVTIRNGAICGIIRPQDVTAARVKVGGVLLPVEDGQPYLAQLFKTMRRSLNKEVCTKYVPGPGGLIAKGTIGGVYVPEADMVVRWISPRDGYRVAP